MRHAYLFFNLFSFATGVTALAVSFFLLSKYRLKVYKKYFIFLLIFAIIYIFDFLDFYFSSFLAYYSKQTKLAFISIKTVFSAIIIYAIADLFFMIVRRLLTSVLNGTLPLFLVYVFSFPMTG